MSDNQEIENKTPEAKEEPQSVEVPEQIDEAGKTHRSGDVKNDNSLLQEIRSVRKENKDVRLENKEIKKQLEQMQSREVAREQRVIRAEMRRIAKSEGLIDEDALQMGCFDTSNFKIEDNGEIKGIEDTVKRVKESKAHLFKMPTSTVSTNFSQPYHNTNVNDTERLDKFKERISKASPQELAAIEKELFGN